MPLLEKIVSNTVSASPEDEGISQKGREPITAEDREAIGRVVNLLATSRSILFVTCPSSGLCPATFCATTRS
jgi:hypothetical protein